MSDITWQEERSDAGRLLQVACLPSMWHHGCCPNQQVRIPLPVSNVPDVVFPVNRHLNDLAVGASKQAVEAQGQLAESGGDAEFLCKKARCTTHGLFANAPMLRAECHLLASQRLSARRSKAPSSPHPAHRTRCDLDFHHHADCLAFRNQRERATARASD